MSDKPDLSALLSMLTNTAENKNVIPEELLSKLMNSSSTHSNNSSSNGDNSKESINHDSTASFSSEKSNHATNTNNVPDMEMMMKLMQVLKSSNQDSPSKELLKSLKPFLNDARKEKVDQYIKILGMTKALEIFNELGDKPK
ncbi:MAG: hypothetical protein IJ220_07040 [Clostridia bacterium]|nr:hypothetical protein [Clostridia bacterium]